MSKTFECDKCGETLEASQQQKTALQLHGFVRHVVFELKLEVKCYEDGFGMPIKFKYCRPCYITIIREALACSQAP